MKNTYKRSVGRKGGVVEYFLIPES